MKGFFYTFKLNNYTLKMSEITFRPIHKNDLKEVIVLLNQLKEIDISIVKHDLAWNNFVSNTS